MATARKLTPETLMERAGKEAHPETLREAIELLLEDDTAESVKEFILWEDKP
jgi:hypothetical protein